MSEVSCPASLGFSLLPRGAARSSAVPAVPQFLQTIAGPPLTSLQPANFLQIVKPECSACRYVRIIVRIVRPRRQCCRGFDQGTDRQDDHAALPYLDWCSRSAAWPAAFRLRHRRLARCRVLAVLPPRPQRQPLPRLPANGTTVNVAAPSTPCCPHQTLRQFLGIKGFVQRHRRSDRTDSEPAGLRLSPVWNQPRRCWPSRIRQTPVRRTRRSLPRPEPRPTKITAPQKIKAIRYLATLGCSGCYPDIEDALLASLDDCTESVRYEAAKAFRELSGSSCATCKTKSCCSPKVRKKLDEVANKMVKNCYKESSARVRRMARLALAGCGGTTPTAAPQEGPSEGPPEKAAAKTADNGDAKTAALALLVNGTGDGTPAATGPVGDRRTPLRPRMPTLRPMATCSKPSAQVRVTQTPMECGCGTTQSASVFIPAATPPAGPPASSQPASSRRQQPRAHRAFRHSPPRFPDSPRRF